MAQHDFVLDNAQGQVFRQDLNDVLRAIVSQNSGTTEPTVTFAYMLWADTTNGLLKIRNSANNAWVMIGTLASTGLGLLSRAGGTLTGALLLNSAASSSAPDLAFSGDANTGIYRVSADIFALVAGGVELCRFDGATAGFIGATFGGTAAVLIPVGTTAQRPSSPANGMMRYNSTTGKFEGYAGGLWKDVGGGGGGAGFAWRAMGGNAASQVEENGEVVNLFGAGLAQELYCSLKVPQSYSPGSQIQLYVSGYSESASNTILLQAQSTLIRPGSTAFDSTTNQRTTTNAALTNTVAKQLREFILDVTDSSGQINGVAVAAGDVIKVRLYRGTDTDTADVRMIPNSTDVKFG